MKYLLSKIENKSSTVCVVGLGYVGLPLAIEFAKRGFQVQGVDKNSDKIQLLNEGISYIDDVDSEIVEEVKQAFDFSASTHYEWIAHSDIVIVCVPTPLDPLGNPDLSFLLDAFREMIPYLHHGMLISLESTTYPGTTREKIAPLLETTGLVVGRDIFLCFSPERINPGCKQWSLQNTPKIVGGMTKTCSEIGKVLYSQIIQDIFLVSSMDAAEMVKILENSFRAINIAFINEIMMLCEKLHLNIWEIIEAAGTKPFGFMKFYPGPGVGGHCIPIDPSYLNWKLKEIGCQSKFIDLAVEMNNRMPQFWVEKITNALHQDQKPLKGSKVLVMGVAYKKDISDFRESPALEIISILLDKGVQVVYHDPFIPFIIIKGEKYFSVKNLMEAICDSDCMIIATNHSCYEEIEYARLSQITINCHGESKKNKSKKSDAAQLTYTWA